MRLKCSNHAVNIMPMKKPQKVKICCISSQNEANIAIEMGASVLGLVGPMPSGPGIIDNQLIKEIKRFGSDVEIAPKRAYVSIRRKKQFALIQPSTKSRLDVGINLKGVDSSGKLEASGSFNAMCSHRVRIESIDNVTPDLIGWLKEAYEQAG